MNSYLTIKVKILQFSREDEKYNNSSFQGPKDLHDFVVYIFNQYY